MDISIHDKMSGPAVKPLAGPIVFIGDSLINGSTATGYNNGITGMFERIEFYTTWYADNRQVAYTVINSGVNGDKTADVLARLNTGALDYSPSDVFANPGINDVGVVTEATFLANWTAIITACLAKPTNLYVILINPATSMTTELAQIRDAWNISLAALCATYPAVKVVNPTRYLGKFRAGGPDGNLWDIVTEYDNGDGTHLIYKGYRQMARACYDRI